MACLDRNGEITGYTARAITSGRIEGTVAVNGSEMKATITGLTPLTQYIVQVAAVNSVGSGPFSPIDVYSTKGYTNIQASSYGLIILSFFFSLSPYPETIVGLDPASFTVSESDEVIEICITAVGANTPCPSAVPFEIILSSLSHTTGMYYNLEHLTAN